MSATPFNLVYHQNNLITFIVFLIVRTGGKVFFKLRVSGITEVHLEGGISYKRPQNTYRQLVFPFLFQLKFEL